MRKYLLWVFIITLMLVMVISVYLFTKKIPLDMSNPATVFCLNQGGDVKMYSGENEPYGMCVLPGGNIECEQWSFFRGECPIIADSGYLRHDCKSEEKTVDVCHEVYQLVCGYTDKDNKEYSNGCFACKDNDVIFWITGPCEE